MSVFSTDYFHIRLAPPAPGRYFVHYVSKGTVLASVGPVVVTGPVLSPEVADGVFWKQSVRVKLTASPKRSDRDIVRLRLIESSSGGPASGASGKQGVCSEQEEEGDGVCVPLFCRLSLFACAMHPPAVMAVWPSHLYFGNFFMRATVLCAHT